MKKLFVLVLIAFISISLNAQRSENIVSKDTVLIDIKKIALVEKTSKETGKRTTYLRYENRNYNSDSHSIRLFIDEKNRCNAYIIYNNYKNGERKVSKIFVSKK